MSTQFIDIDFPIRSFLANTVSSYLSSEIGSTIFGEWSVTTSVNQTSFEISVTAPSIATTISLSTDNKLNFTIDPQSIASTFEFAEENARGDAAYLSRSIEVPSIASTINFGTTFQFVSIGVQPFAGVQTFGDITDVRDVHRSLIFKDDNITKLGSNNDDVEIASGVVIRAATQVLTGNTVPGSAAGFVTVVINGVDYKMPFFNI